MKTLIYFLLLIPVFACASEKFDFTLVAHKCSTTAAYSKLGDDALKTIEGDKPVLECNRSKRALNCLLSFQEKDGKPEVRTYEIYVDAPPYLVFSNKTKTELVSINTTHLAASYRANFFDVDFLGAKVCNMVFLTPDIAKQIDKM